jgi:hypothetical protein
MVKDASRTWQSVAPNEIMRKNDKLNMCVMSNLVAKTGTLNITED